MKRNYKENLNPVKEDSNNTTKRIVEEEKNPIGKKPLQNIKLSRAEHFSIVQTGFTETEPESPQKEIEMSEEKSVKKRFLKKELKKLDCKYCDPTRIFSTYDSLKNHEYIYHQELVK